MHGKDETNGRGDDVTENDVERSKNCIGSSKEIKREERYFMEENEVRAKEVRAKEVIVSRDEDVPMEDMKVQSKASVDQQVQERGA